MISNQVLQNTLEGLKEISRTEFCVLDTEGKVLASTFADFSIATQDVQAFVESQADSQLVKGFQYFKVCDDYQLEYILVAHGDDEDTYMVGKLAAFQIQNLIVAYKERFDKDSFIKNLLLDNLLLVDIYNRAKKLHIENLSGEEVKVDYDGEELPEGFPVDISIIPQAINIVVPK